MRVRMIGAILGVILTSFSITMLPPLLVNYCYQDQVGFAFIASAISVGVSGFLLWLTNRQSGYDLRNVEAILLVVLTWLSLSFCSTLPFLFYGINDSFLNVLFESVSGITTTGINVIKLNNLPNTFLYYRQQLEFFGGMGIVLFAIAILPLLSVGGMQLYRAEIGGPIKDNKVLPNIKSSAMVLWFIYGGLTLSCALCYKLAGMSWFEAICDSFGTVSTGGFSLHSSSFSFYDSKLIDAVCMFFMLLGAINFSLHFRFFTRLDFKVYWRHFESRAFFWILFMSISTVFLFLLNIDYYHNVNDTFFSAAFTVVSMLTTTGLTNNNFAVWPSFLPIFVMLLALIGGCSGSTTGGMKVMRIIYCCREGVLALRQLCHPHAVYSLRHLDDNVTSAVVSSIRGFFVIFIFIYFTLIILVMVTGESFYNSFAEITSCISGVGASIGDVAQDFSHLQPSTKALLIFTMILGRLEVMTVMVLFLPDFWRS